MSSKERSCRSDRAVCITAAYMHVQRQMHRCGCLDFRDCPPKVATMVIWVGYDDVYMTTQARPPAAPAALRPRTGL